MSGPPTSSKPPSVRADAESVIATLIAKGHIAYLAGGCVRDQLLGIEPKDFDVATDAPPERIRKIFPHTQAVGAAFGVVLVRMNKSQIEVATFRSDGQYLDGRHPSSVRFSTPQEDAQRRDFTINGLFYDVQQQRVIDFVGGVDDLNSRTLRAIGQPRERFAEDQLRLLRAVRFAARFGLQIETATQAAIAALAPQLTTISPERIAEELRSMSAPPTRRHAWTLLIEFGLESVIFRFAPTATHQATLATQLDDAPATLPLVLAAHALGRHELSECNQLLVQQYCKALRTALRWSNHESDAFGELLATASAVIQMPNISLAQKRRWTALPTFTDLQRLLVVLAKVDHRYKRPAAIRAELAALAMTPNPKPFINGDDLLALGLRAGPAFKRALEATYDAQLEERVRTREASMEYAQRILQSEAGPL